MLLLPAANCSPSGVSAWVRGRGKQDAEERRFSGWTRIQNRIGVNPLNPRLPPFQSSGMPTLTAAIAWHTMPDFN